MVYPKNLCLIHLDIFFLPSMLHEHKISKSMRTLKQKIRPTRSLQTVIIWLQIPCVQTTSGICATLLAMIVLDFFVVPIHIAATIADNPSHPIHLIMNVSCKMPLLNLPFIIMEMRKLWEMLRLVVNIAMKWKVLMEAVVFVNHILKVFLNDSDIHNIPPYI
jgi:hypothetical protein